MNPKVDIFLSKTKRWKKELELLRSILLDTELTEELKWGVPCYTFCPPGNKKDHNLVALGELKECCVLSFFKGVLLKDSKGILVKPGENTQSARIIRFTNVSEIAKMKPILKAYINEAIEAEKAGWKINFKKPSEFDVPEEFKNKLNEVPSLKNAFDALTPGRQRAYLLYFSAPKQSKTRETRIEKCIQKILEGRGLND